MTVYSAKKIFVESMPVVTVSVVIGLVAGVVLESWVKTLVSIPFLLMLIPPLNKMGGDFGIVLSSRLSTALHLGTVRPKLEPNPVLTQNLLGVLAVALASSAYVALAVYASAALAGVPTLPPHQVLILCMLVGGVLSLTIVATGVVCAIASYAYGWDPDNTVIPIVTSVADVVGVVSLMALVRALAIA